MTNARRDTWDKYTEAWSETTVERKLAALRVSVRSSATYRDPLVVAEGHDALVAYMLDFHAQLPGGHFVTTYFQAHHDRSIAKWNMVDGAGAIVGEGVSYGEYDDSGMLAGMTGFFATPTNTPT